MMRRRYKLTRKTHYTIVSNMLYAKKYLLLTIITPIVFFCLNSNVSPSGKIETDAEEKYQIASLNMYYERYGAGYENAKIVKIDLINPITFSAKFLLFLLFPEIKVDFQHKIPLFYDNSFLRRNKENFVILPYLDGLTTKVDRLLCYIDDKKHNTLKQQILDVIESIANPSILPSFKWYNPETYDARIMNYVPYLELWSSPLTSSDVPMAYKNVVDEFSLNLKKQQAKISQILKDNVPDPQLLSIIYLVEGWGYARFEQHEEALKMYDKVINYNIDDYALSASFYKALSIGALEKNTSISILYKRFLSTYCYHENNPKARNEYIERLSKSESAKNIFRDVLHRYKHLETDRKVIFIWCKEILAGKPLPELDSDSALSNDKQDKSDKPKEPDKPAGNNQDKPKEETPK